MIRRILNAEEISDCGRSGHDCAGSALALPVLNVGTQPVFQPFEFVDGRTKQLVGYDIDLIRAAAKHMGYEIKFAPMGLDGLIPAVMTGTLI